MKNGWHIALIGMTVLALSLGIGRFLLTPLLPMMQTDAGLSLITGGWLASINNLGYLTGALLCALYPLPQRGSLRAGLVIIALTTLGMGLTTAPALWLLMRLLAGVASAILTVHGISWSMAHLRAMRHHGREPLVFCGTGVGIVISGVTVAALQPLGITSAQCWIMFGLIAFAATAIIWCMPAQPLPSTHHAQSSMPAEHASGHAWTLVVAYGLLGFAYVIPATFLPLIADQQLHLPALREWFWPLYGSATTLLTLAVGVAPSRWNNRNLLVACCISMASGIALCLAWPSVTGLVLGTLLIGAVTMPIVMFVMREARLLKPGDPTRLIAVATTVFGIGQIVGPLLAASLAQHQHGFTTPLLLSVAAIIAAAMLLLHRTRMPDPASARPESIRIT